MARKKTFLDKSKLEALRKILKDTKLTAVELARFQAIFMFEKEHPIAFIQEITNLNKTTIYKWRTRFSKAGKEALLQRKPKPRALLTKNQINVILGVIKNQKPRDYGYESDFWTTTILAHLIKEQYNVQYKTKKPIYILFKKAKFTYHKPGQQYKKRDQKVVDEWVKKYQPIIAAHRSDEDTVVLVGDEMILSTQTTFQKIWLPQNDYPKIDISNDRQSRSIYGFLNVKKGVEHAYKTNWQNSDTTCKVLDKLCANYKGKKIVLIWDKASWHRSKEVRQWLDKTEHDIFLIAFPTCAPDLNPQEHVWKEGRSSVTHNRFIDDIDKATDEFVDHLNGKLFNYAFL